MEPKEIVEIIDNLKDKPNKYLIETKELLNTEFENLLKLVSPIMWEIFKVYFPWEISLSEDIDFLECRSRLARYY